MGHTSGRTCKRSGLGHLLLCTKSAHEPIDGTSKHLSVSAELSRFTHNHRLFLLFRFCCPYFEECFHSFKTDQPKTGLKMKTKDRENQKKEKLCYRNYPGILFFSTNKKEGGKSNKNPCPGKTNDFSEMSLVSQSLLVLERRKCVLNSFQLVLIGISPPLVPWRFMSGSPGVGG